MSRPEVTVIKVYHLNAHFENNNNITPSFLQIPKAKQRLPTSSFTTLANFF